MHIPSALFEHRGDGLDTNLNRAIKPYETAVVERKDADEMYNLASVMEYGCKGVNSYLKSSIQLYGRGIKEGILIGAVNNCGVLMNNGGHVVIKDLKRSVARNIHSPSKVIAKRAWSELVFLDMGKQI